MKFLYKKTNQIIETDVDEKIEKFRKDPKFFELDDNGNIKPKRKAGRPKKEEE